MKYKMCNLLKSSELSDTTILLRPSENSPFYASPSLQLYRYYGLRFALKGVLTSSFHSYITLRLTRSGNRNSVPTQSADPNLKVLVLKGQCHEIFYLYFFN